MRKVILTCLLLLSFILTMPALSVCAAERQTDGETVEESQATKEPELDHDYSNGVYLEYGGASNDIDNGHYEEDTSDLYEQVYTQILELKQELRFFSIILTAIAIAIFVAFIILCIACSQKRESSVRFEENESKAEEEINNGTVDPFE